MRVEIKFLSLGLIGSCIVSLREQSFSSHRTDTPRYIGIGRDVNHGMSQFTTWQSKR